MPQDPILDPPDAQGDTDYVRCFDKLAAVEVEIRRRGPSPHLLVRRAMVLMAVGNYTPALQAARDAVRRSPRCGEGHFQEGLAWLGLARVQCGATMAPGATVPLPRPLTSLLENAYEAFCAAAQCAAMDDEAIAASRSIEALLQLDESGIVRRLSAA